MIELNGNLFDWDDDKNDANIIKHGISFPEASTVFLDLDAVIIEDEAHSEDEERFLIIGFNANARLLVVCHCYRDNDNVVRIISARKANREESDLYGGAK